MPAGARFGLFTSHLLDGLRGAAASADGYVRVFDLFEYVQPLVTPSRRDQHPVFKAEVEENFAVAASPGAVDAAAPPGRRRVPLRRLRELRGTGLELGLADARA